MALQKESPELILPTRMTLHVPANISLCFSTLEFPYKNALNRFMARFERNYKQQHNRELSYALKPPYRQLNDAIIALAPGLIQAFEDKRELGRMVAFTRYEEDLAEDFPTQLQLRSLVRHWLVRWAEQQDIQTVLQRDSKEAWGELMQALDGDFETGWQHNITPGSFAADLLHDKGLAYRALPALLTTLLHDKTMVIQSDKGEYRMTWRRVNAGGSDGLHLVSQPILHNGDYFAYRLDFSVQTQVGYVDNRGNSRPWIFAHLSIQRYIAEQYQKSSDKRNISILVGFNREQFVGGWDDDTTLVRLSVKKKGGKWVWESGVGQLLNSFGIRNLFSPDDIFAAPQRYGNFSGADNFSRDEYYVVYAEGRKFGDERGRGHQVKTGTSLRERSQIMEGVVSLLSGWLKVSTPLQCDAQNPKNTFALRDYDYMVDERKDNSKQQAAWQTALQTSLVTSGYQQAHIVVLHRTPNFAYWAKTQIQEALMGVDNGDDPLVTVSYVQLPSVLYAALDPGDLDPQMVFKPHQDNPPGFDTRWRNQMRESYGKKREVWRRFLQTINWEPNARRLVLIDSTGEGKIPITQKIKGAIRDACNREGIQSQFIVGRTLKSDDEGDLNSASAGRLKNAILDLLLRQQAILYGPPHEIYAKAAKLDATMAKALDIIAFCRVNRTGLHNFNYVLAVRLRADGRVHVMLPNDMGKWVPYDMAAQQFGLLVSNERVALKNSHQASALKMSHAAMLNFVHEILTKRLEQSTIAVIEAEGWRNGRGPDDQKHCWTQLRNKDLFQYLHLLRFDRHRSYERDAVSLDNLLAVVRLRMNAETPQYITAADWTAEEPMHDIPHLTSYIDPVVAEPLHFMSVAGLPKTQKKQKEKQVVESFKADIPTSKYDDIAFKHAQLIEMVPFFVHPAFQQAEVQHQLCRCVHFLRNSPGFTMGDITLPYPMHLGVSLIEDQLCIINADA